MNSGAISLGPSLRRRVGGRPVPRDQGRSQAIPGDNGDTRATRRLEYEGLSEDVCWGRRVLLARLAKTLDGTFPLGKHHLNTAIYDVQYLEQAISPIPLSMRKSGEGRATGYYIICPMSPRLAKITRQQQWVHDMWFGKRKRSKSWMISWTLSGLRTTHHTNHLCSSSSRSLATQPPIAKLQSPNRKNASGNNMKPITRATGSTPSTQ
jgi:hypothetical protein